MAAAPLSAMVTAFAILWFFIKFLFKYNCGVDINGEIESKFLHNGGTYPLISRCKQYDFMRSDDINIFESDTDEIVRYLYIRLTRKYSVDTLKYSDESLIIVVSV